MQVTLPLHIYTKHNDGFVVYPILEIDNGYFIGLEVPKPESYDELPWFSTEDEAKAYVAEHAFVESPSGAASIAVLAEKYGVIDVSE